MWCKMFKNAINSKKQGDIGLGSAIQYFSSMGYTVLLPLTDSQDYDLAIDDGYTIKTVQVKTTQYKQRGKFTCNLRLMGGNRRKYIIAKKREDFKYDLLFILTADGDRYLIDKENIEANNSITLCEKYKKFMI